MSELQVIPQAEPWELVIQAGSRRGLKLTLDRPRLIIGRDVSTGLRVVDVMASRQHAVLVREGDTLILRDLQSRNGTYVNGTQVESEIELQSGDSFRVGGTTFEVHQIAGGFSGSVPDPAGTDRTQSTESREAGRDRSMN